MALPKKYQVMLVLLDEILVCFEGEFYSAPLILLDGAEEEIGGGVTSMRVWLSDCIGCPVDVTIASKYRALVQ